MIVFTTETRLFRLGSMAFRIIERQDLIEIHEFLWVPLGSFAWHVGRKPVPGH